MNAESLYLECSKLIGPDYPAGMMAIPPPAPVAGCGFFPVSSGSMHDGDLTRELSRKVLFVGQDWGCEENLRALSKDKDADSKTGTGRILHELIIAAGIPTAECFFTNALFGVRRGHRNTGRSPGWRDRAFRQRCKEALTTQIREIGPQVIVCLGRDASHLLAEIFPALAPWKSSRNFREIDLNENALIGLDPEQSLGLIAGAILVHPSFRHINAKQRAHDGRIGNDAEMDILGNLWDRVK